MSHIKNFFNEFKEFAVKGNVVDLAVGIIIGTAFNTIVQSLVKDIILPPIGLLLQKVDFSNLYVSLNGEHYATIAEAQKNGAPTINYGLFINNLISFIVTAFAVFVVIRWINAIRRRRENKDQPVTTKTCPFCYSSVNIKATRCPECTSTLS
jgi:large conductance mechanosensitive channel